jgi:serine/threonine protein kinase
MKTVANTASADLIPAREASLQEYVHSDHVVDIHKKFKKENGDVVILEELMAGGELSHKILEGGGLSAGHKERDVMHQIVEGVKTIHDKNVVHLDLKPGNIWFNGYEAKIGHFSAAMEVDGDTKQPINQGASKGTLPYAAPELMRKRIINSTYGFSAEDLKAADVWSLGVTFYNILAGRLPWDMNIRDEGDAQTFIERLDREGLSALYVPLPKSVDRDANDLIQHMLELDSSKRYTIDQVANHKFFDAEGSSGGAGLSLEQELAAFKQLDGIDWFDDEDQVGVSLAETETDEDE